MKMSRYKYKGIWQSLQEKKTELWVGKSAIQFGIDHEVNSDNNNIWTQEAYIY